ncbi:hypothetical protein I6N90_20105 [Paenibacillus sp. GSMTC-2017]|uniref:hypothetical protein n=1 Tax=Paenibacillus sp. GSMTC-2017 TaxID=2794350 RepID=UPI0018D714B9|nr:hypothetical protein [Paenibacillus sp. GSMTC-2017]MBH5320111.1 hypothetical protein [Paenibacillus sp. GSMTC-2017]
MNYAANVSGGANSHFPVGGAHHHNHCGPVVGGCGNNVGSILVLFILLVIITRAICF